MTGTVFNIQRFSLYDGPGIRTVVFLKGCPLRCLWCHNPEGISLKPQLLYAADRCIGCGSCVSACRRGRHAMVEEGHRYQKELCLDCGACVDTCVSGALRMAGSQMTVEQVMDRVMADARYYKNEGGITLSGGEPLLQWQFAASILAEAHRQGVNTCLETAGFAEEKPFRAVTAHVDTLYFDYKATGEEAHRRLTGVSQEKILHNLAIADSLGIPTVLRCPVIPGSNDTEEHFSAIGKLAQKTACVKAVHLEPYHRVGLSKSEQIGQIPFEAEVPTKEAMNAHREAVACYTDKKVEIL